MSAFGYAGNILKIDLGSRSVSKLSTLDYAEGYLGGRGIAARLYWDSVPPGISAFSPENAIIFATGPLAGIPVIGGSRWVVCARSQETCESRGSNSTWVMPCRSRRSIKISPPWSRTVSTHPHSSTG